MAVSILSAANVNGDTKFADEILLPNSATLRAIVDGKGRRAAAHVHIVMKPPTVIRTSTGLVNNNRVTVHVTYVQAAYQAINDKGQVVEDQPSFNMVGNYDMVYGGGRWRIDGQEFTGR